MRNRAGRHGGGSVALGIVAVVLMTVASAVGCSDDSRPVSQQAPAGTGVKGGGTLRIGVTRRDPSLVGSGFDTLDPADVFPTNQADMIAIDLLFESLTTIDPATNEVRPALASAFTPNADQSVWTFVVRDDAVFSDGTPVTATDAKFSLERVARKGSASIAGSALEVIAGYPEFLADPAATLSGLVVVDAKTLQITAARPSATLPELLASPTFGIVPRAAVIPVPSTLADRPVGSGAFKFVGTDGDVVTLVRAPGATTVVDGVQLIMYSNQADAVQAVADGRADWAAVPTGTPAGEVGKAGKAGKAGIVKPGAKSSERFFGFNLGSPLYGLNPEFRKAIVRAVNRSRIATEVLDSSMPLNGVVPPGLSSAGLSSAGLSPAGADPCPETCGYDVEAAKALLATAFPYGVIPGVRIDYYTGTTEEDQVQQRVAEAMQADLKVVGIEAELAPKSFDEYRAFAVSEDRQVFSYGWVGLAPEPGAYLDPLFRSTSTDNVTGFNDAGIDLLLATARATADRAARDNLYAAIEQQVMATAPLIPLAVLDSSVVVSGRVADYQPRFDGTFDGEKVRIAE